MVRKIGINNNSKMVAPALALTT